MKYRVYNDEEKNQVYKLAEEGMNKSDISRRLNIPRGTLKHWLNPRPRKTNIPRNSYSPIIDFDHYLNSSEKRAAYSFTLAVYLCDGCISEYKTFRAPSMRLTNDSKYPKNTEEWIQKLKTVLPNNSVSMFKKKCSNCYVVSTYSKKLIDLFPQHGSGRKHNRKLLFADWQIKIIREFPEEFIRGCIQSDGCIYFQKVSGKVYKRYSFCNMSEDIIDLVLMSLSFVGIMKNKWQNLKTGKFVIQNFSKKDTAILESIIQTKE